MIPTPLILIFPIPAAARRPTYYAPPRQEIIGPLLAALPENDKRKTLQAVYSKAQRAKTGQGEPDGGGIAGLFGGWGGGKSKKDAGSAPAAAGAKGKGGAASAGAAAAADPFAFATAKLSGKDLQLFKSRTALYSRGGINAR